MLQALTYFKQAPDGPEERCDYTFQEYTRLYGMATAGTLIIGTLYVSTVFVCMALAILSLKTLSTLDEERRRFAVLYRLGANRCRAKLFMHSPQKAARSFWHLSQKHPPGGEPH